MSGGALSLARLFALADLSRKVRQALDRDGRPVLP
jgi:hypothetical protein